jgi:hypothetical protein
MKIVITKEIPADDDLWGVNELIASSVGLSKDELDTKLIELFYEDINEFLNQSEWKIER